MRNVPKTNRQISNMDTNNFFITPEPGMLVHFEHCYIATDFLKDEPDDFTYYKNKALLFNMKKSIVFMLIKIADCGRTVKYSFSYVLTENNKYQILDLYVAKYDLRRFFRLLKVPEIT